jgi:hypothetical protein
MQNMIVRNPQATLELMLANNALRMVQSQFNPYYSYLTNPLLGYSNYDLAVAQSFYPPNMSNEEAYNQLSF